MISDERSADFLETTSEQGEDSENNTTSADERRPLLNSIAW